LNALGRHLVADFHGCTSDLNNPEVVMAALEGACDVAGATIISRTGYHFSPYGVTSVVVIAESHLAVHTWPEYGYAAVDLFTCGDTVDTYGAFEYVKKAFGATRVELKEMPRGILSQAEMARADAYTAPAGSPAAA
jgi:S-adenosylmethionine decarboxylase proenzyme